MHSSLSRPALPCLAAVFLTLCLFAGCTTSPDGALQGDAVMGTERDSVLALLAALDSQTFTDAFDALPRYTYARQTRTEQRRSDSSLVAAYEQDVRFQNQGDRRTRTVTAADSSGAFEQGLFGFFASSDSSRTDPPSVAPYMVPDDPAYLSPRNQEDFTYHRLPDTTIGQAQALVVEVRARPSSSQNLRRLRLAVDPETRLPLAIHLERADQSLLYREQSVFDLEMQATASGDRLPHRTRVQANLKRFFRPTQRFTTTSTYSGFEEME
ncbi:MAG: hypothetical protein ACR2GR_04210 [Rhodothermales bacterium]